MNIKAIERLVVDSSAIGELLPAARSNLATITRSLDEAAPGMTKYALDTSKRGWFAGRDATRVGLNPLRAAAPLQAAADAAASAHLLVEEVYHLANATGVRAVQAPVDTIVWDAAQLRSRLSQMAQEAGDAANLGRTETALWVDDSGLGLAVRRAAPWTRQRDSVAGRLQDRVMAIQDKLTAVERALENEMQLRAASDSTVEAAKQRIAHVRAMREELARSVEAGA